MCWNDLLFSFSCSKRLRSENEVQVIIKFLSESDLSSGVIALDWNWLSRWLKCLQVLLLVVGKYQQPEWVTWLFHSGCQSIRIQRKKVLLLASFIHAITSFRSCVFLPMVPWKTVFQSCGIEMLQQKTVLPPFPYFWYKLMVTPSMSSQDNNKAQDILCLLLCSCSKQDDDKTDSLHLCCGLNSK